MNKITKAIEQKEFILYSWLYRNLGDPQNLHKEINDDYRRSLRQSQINLIEAIIKELKTRQYMIQDGTDFNGGVEAGYRYVELMLREVIDKKQ